METTAPLLALKNIVVKRGGRLLVDNVSLNITNGKMLALMGENGAGKSTLLKVASGDFVPDSGAVMLGEKQLGDWTALERATRRAVLPQETNTAFMFTALEVVLLGRSPHCNGYPKARDVAIAHAALAQLDMQKFTHRLFPTLSGGERARVALARILAQLWEAASSAPRVMLLDEPIAALDIAHQHLALQVARDFAQQDNCAALLVLHDLNLAAQYADEIALLKNGQLMALGTPDHVLSKANMANCFGCDMRRITHPETGRPILFAA